MYGEDFLSGLIGDYDGGDSYYRDGDNPVLGRQSHALSDSVADEKGTGRMVGIKITGTDKSVPAHLAVMELDDLITPVNPLSWIKNDKYPYPACMDIKSLPFEVGRLTVGAMPEEFLCNVPDSITGLPVATEDGVIVAGIEKILALKLIALSSPEKFGKYVKMLSELTVTSMYAVYKNIAGLHRPVLVRVADIQDMETVDSFLSCDNQALPESAGLEGMDEHVEASTDVQNARWFGANDRVEVLQHLPTAVEIRNTVYTQKPLILNRTKELFKGRLLDDANILIAGAQGSGKSTLALLLGEDLSRNGDTLYVYAEEKVGQRLKELMDRLNINAPRLHFLETKSFDDIVKYLSTGQFRFVILDSHNTVLGASQQQLLRLMTDFPDIAFTVISRMDKENKSYKGDGNWSYDVDTFILMNDGTATAIKHRDGENEGSLQVFGKKAFRVARLGSNW